MCFCHSGDWNFSPAICKHEYDPKSLCGWVLHIHGFVSTSIFLWVYCAGRPWSYTHSTKMGNLFSLHSSTNVFLLYCYPNSSFLIKSNELNWLLCVCSSMISSMSFLVLPWSSQFWLHLFWTTHLQGMSLRRTGVWCGHASSGTLIGIQETLSFIVFLWVYIGSSQRCDRKKSYVIEHLLWAYFSQAVNKHFVNTRKHMFWSEIKSSHEDQVFVHTFSPFGVFFCLIPKFNIMFWQKGQSLYISEQCNDFWV